MVFCRIDTRYCSTNSTLSSAVTARMITAPPGLLRSAYSQRPRLRKLNQRPSQRVSTGALASSGIWLEESFIVDRCPGKTEGHVELSAWQRQPATQHRAVACFAWSSTWCSAGLNAAMLAGGCG